jgi:glyoxylase-like metal-dependent hydrolase (beta-lactamase superfamily II)
MIPETENDKTSAAAGRGNGATGVKRHMARVELVDYPIAEPPAGGQVIKVAPGIFWLRMPLDLTGLDHINLWLLEDGEGYAIVDTGMLSDRIKELWAAILERELGGRPVTRIICTHFHPDHMGLAGWLQERTGAPLWTSRREWLFGRMLYLDAQDQAPEWYIEHFRRVGFSAEAREQLRAHGYNNYRNIVSPIPEQFRRLVDGEEIVIGPHSWRIVTGYGHAPEHVCLYCGELGVMISGDQILPRITPHIGVYPAEPDANPLQEYIDSLELFAGYSDDLLILPAHGLPFHGLQRRLGQLREHHDDRLALLEEACDEPVRVLSTLKVMYGRRLKPFEAFLGVGEAIAHMNCLIGQGRVRREVDEEGVWIYRAARSRADAA